MATEKIHIDQVRKNMQPKKPIYEEDKEDGLQTNMFPFISGTIMYQKLSICRRNMTNSQ